MCFTQAVPWNYLRVDVEILTEIQDLDADAEKHRVRWLQVSNRK